MKNNKKDIKEFDAIKFMRNQRNRISKELTNLSPEQIIEYFNKHKRTLFSEKE
ncbi:MAG: hypothetical protein NTW25_06685 [Candidatus Kapabacteria bacterium]|nr:hypothetical protein [Candidatus Kapabacteria bacterium]